MPPATAAPVIVTTPTPTAELPTLVPSATPESAIWCWQRDRQLGDPNNDWIVFDDQGAPVVVPCNGIWPDADEQPAQDEPTQEPTVVPTSTPMVIVRQAPAPTPEVRVVVQTVVVLVTTEPTQTATRAPSTTPMPLPTRTPVTPTRVVETPTRSPSPTVTSTPSPTSTPLPTATVTSTPAPTVLAARVASPLDQLTWPPVWAIAAALGVLVLGSAAFVWFRFFW